MKVKQSQPGCPGQEELLERRSKLLGCLGSGSDDQDGNEAEMCDAARAQQSQSPDLQSRG